MCLGCHVVAVNVEFKDLNAIKAACKRLKWVFCEHQKTYTWFGRWVDDSPTPRHLFTTEAEYKRVCAMEKADRIEYMNKLLGTCTHAIKVPGCNYEIGLIQQGDKFVPIWDWYEGKLNSAMRQEGGPLVQAYAVEKAKLAAQAYGNTWTESIHQDGSVELTINIPEY